MWHHPRPCYILFLHSPYHPYMTPQMAALSGPVQQYSRDTVVVLVLKWSSRVRPKWQWWYLWARTLDPAWVNAWPMATRVLAETIKQIPLSPVKKWGGTWHLALSANHSCNFKAKFWKLWSCVDHHGMTSRSLSWPLSQHQAKDSTPQCNQLGHYSKSGPFHQ